MKKITLVLIVCIFLSTALFGCDKDDEEWAKAVQEYRDNKMTIYAEENAEYEDYEVDVAFIGDSLTDGYDVKSYYKDRVVSNRGIGGDTTFDLEGRLQVSLFDLRPKVTVMLIGANNLESMFDNYENILISLKENLPNTKVILLSLTSMGGEHWGKNNQLAAYNNVKIKLLAEKYSFDFVDLYSPLMNLETGEIYPEYTTDGGHLTPQGYEVLTREITPAIDKQLAAWNAENGR